MTTGSRWLILAGLLALATAIYWPGLSGPWLLDDFTNVLPNRPQSAAASDLVDAALANRTGLLRRPVANLSFGINYRVAAAEGPEVDPFSYKLVNLLLHLAAAVLVCLLVTRLAETRSDAATARRVGLLAAALWALHPLQVSSVLYVVQRMALLASIFSIAAVLLYLQTRLRGLRGAHLVAPVTGISVLLAAGLFSKESAAITPLLLLALELTVLAGRDSRSPGALILRSLFIWLPLCAGLAGLLLIWPYVVGTYANLPYSMDERLLTQLVLLCGYLQQALLPLPQQMGLFLDGVQPLGPGWLPLACACVIAVLLGLGLALRRRAPLLSLGLFWFFAAHAMESTILPLELAFEHRNYLAIAGPLWIVAWLAAGSRARLALPAGVLFLAVLAALTGLRVQTWKSESDLLVAEYRRHPESLRASAGMFQVALARGRPDLTRRITASLAPEHPMAAHVLSLYQACYFGDPLPGQPPAVGSAEQLKSFSSLLRPLVGVIRDDKCQTGVGPATQQTVAALLASPRLPWTSISRLRLLQLAAWMAGDEDPHAAAEIFERAIVLFPGEPDPRFQKAYLWLNAGHADLARSEVARIRRNAGRFAVPVDARLAELEAFLAQAGAGGG